MKNSVRLICTALGVVVTTGVSWAQPSNDGCAGALPVVDGSNSLNNANATQDTQIPCVVGGPAQSGADVWYAYTAPATGVRNFELSNFVRTTGAANGNGTLALYDACGGTLLACDDNGGIGPHAKIRHFPVQAGTTYLLRFSNRGGVTLGLMGTATLTISAPPTPIAVDDCQLALPFAGQGSVGFTTFGLTNYDRHTWDCKNFLNDGWIAWTPSATGIGVVDACGALGAGNLTLAVQRGCEDIPLICRNSTQGYLDPGPGCGPKICFDVVTGQTYLVRYGRLVESVTDPVSSGNINFDVRVPGAGIAIPAGALSEPGNCSDAPAADLNGGCTVQPNVFTPAALCQAYTGKATSRLLPLISVQNIPGSFPDMLTVDTDWYEFTIDSDQSVTITGESEFWPQMSIVFGCPATVIQSQPGGTPNCQGLYTLGITTGTLVAGTYALKISPQSDNFSTHGGDFTNDCDKGSRYWFKITGAEPCVPTTERCCRGTTCVDVTAGSCTGIVAGSASVVVGTCTGNTNTGCCYADYDHNGMTEVTDIFGYLNAWFSGSPYADVGGNGTSVPDINDIFTYLNNWFAGCN